MGFDRSFAVNISATYGDCGMPGYVLGHHLKGEGKRLALMSELLDPMHRRYLESLDVVKSGARTLEVGCGNGSISAWLARQVAPDGRAMAVEKAMANLVASLRPGGAILLIEPDFLPVAIAEPPEVCAFWSGWLAWSRDQGIDYHIGRSLAPRLAALGLQRISGTAETAIYNGTSLWADYWTQTVKELRADLISSGKLNNVLVDTFLGYCADPAWWTQTIAFTAVHGYAPDHY